MNALVSIRALGDESHAVSSATRARVTQDIAVQQSPAKAVEALEESLKALQAATTTTKSASTATTLAKSTDGASSTTTTSTSNALSRDAFLNLLVCQLQNQDPMSPTDNSQMIAQLAQFSSLEQMTNLNSSFTTLSDNINRLNFVSASALVGQTVTGTDGDGNTVQGTV